MQKKTLHKILQDPLFDPAIFLEQAIVEYIKKHPVEVAKDKVALRHLVGDPSTAANVFQLVDINDLDLVRSYLQAIPGIPYGQSDAVSALTERLHKLREENVAEMLEIIKESIGKVSGLDTPKSLYHITPIMGENDLDEMMTIMLKNASLTLWKPNDWKVAIKTEDGQKALIKTIPKISINDADMFQLLSLLGTTLKGTKLANKLLELIRTKWKTYICFNCGKGKGPWKPISYRPERGKNDFIKSISGYTLHRKKCDPENKFLSPHEIIEGRSMKLRWECDRGCGATFTTLSGKTLHGKTCIF